MAYIEFLLLLWEDYWLGYFLFWGLLLEKIWFFHICLGFFQLAEGIALLELFLWLFLLAYRGLWFGFDERYLLYLYVIYWGFNALFFGYFWWLIFNLFGWLFLIENRFINFGFFGFLLILRFYIWLALFLIFYYCFLSFF